MSSSAVSFGEGCAVAPSCAESPTESCSEMQQDSCPSMQETSGSYFEEEADFLTELLVKQEAADAHPMQLFVDDGAESSGTQAALSDVSTTLGDWDIDCIVPDLGYGPSMVSNLQVPLNPTSLMLQLDYGDVISAWEEMSSDSKHPISDSVHQHAHADQMITLQSPSLYTVPKALSNTDAVPASIPRFTEPPRMAARSSANTRSSLTSHVHGHCLPHSSAMDPLQGHAACPPAQQACTAHTAAEKTASLERYRVKKATRQSGGSKIRYQIRKTNADNRPRFKGCFVKPSKLAELQMEAALNRNIGDLYFPSSPISGGSSDSTFH